MIDFTEISHEGETWELFARDFLEANGFYIESSVDRGADGKKDMIVQEYLQGTLGRYPFRWLVSCKHNAKSGKSVSEKDEPNILERLRAWNCDGFIGFYSTVPSSGLNSRLHQLKENSNIKDYRIFDGKLIENYLIRIGFSTLVMRYFSESYKKIKPLHLIMDEYIPLICDCCGKDILEEMSRKSYSALIAYLWDRGENRRQYKDIYIACKGDCDQTLEQMYKNEHGWFTSWYDLSDLVIPTMFIDHVLSIMNNLRDDASSFDEQFFKKYRKIVIALSQKVLREMTEEERQRTRELFQFHL